jgi:signal transduction histidine kinase
MVVGLEKPCALKSKAKNEAELVNRVKSELLANMSHGFRTLMNAIIGMTHLALQSDLNDKQHNYSRFFSRPL